MEHELEQLFERFRRNGDAGAPERVFDGTASDPACPAVAAGTRDLVLRVEG